MIERTQGVEAAKLWHERVVTLNTARNEFPKVNPGISILSSVLATKQSGEGTTTGGNTATHHFLMELAMGE